MRLRHGIVLVALLATSPALAKAGERWVGIGISTGKFSESITSSVFFTQTECLAANLGEAKTCFPIPAAPSTESTGGISWPPNVPADRPSTTEKTPAE